jgi:hypothetical protein
MRLGIGNDNNHVDVKPRRPAWLGLNGGNGGGAFNNRCLASVYETIVATFANKLTILVLALI